MGKKLLSIFFLLILYVSITIYNRYHTSSLSVIQSSSAFPTVLGQQTKSSHCQYNSVFPDTACTPGAVFHYVTLQEICTSGYSSSVRNVSLTTKKEVYAEYDIYHHTTGEYEVDHLISLELGGSNDIANLWPEPANPTPGFHEKDLVENYLHEMVCNGKMSLATAQSLIAHNWLYVYKNVSNIQSYSWNNRHN